ncbi:type II toxin-antitoxin system HicA family toxin [Sulfurivermis fontis]|uniref:type II toxin-antitoxin system HicA family toxin n=1 Tax=Sulfurivermis fontis TaxID=1972068 RepID=UPI000FD83402|nr:type II toxin-antitoxin system HicA family toxin [Sulfurivermis fontis]
MSHKHEQLLQTIMHGPASGNIHWREVESMLHHLGASIEPAHGARMRVVLNGVEGFVHKPHHSGTCEKSEIRHLRDFLAAAGFSGG